MTKKNPFKSIEPSEPLPEELKENILQNIEEIIEESNEDSNPEDSNGVDEQSN